MKVLITGVGRCGTRAIARSLNRAKHEFIREFRGASNARFDGESDQGYLEKRIPEISETGPLIEVSCLAWNLVDLIDDGKRGFVFVRRDKERSVASMMKTPLYTGALPWKLRAKTGFIDPRTEGYEREERLHNCRRIWDIRTAAIEKAFLSIPDDRKLTVQFEEITTKASAWAQVRQFVQRHTSIQQKRRLVNDPHRSDKRYRK